MGSGAELFVDGPEPQDEQGPREGTRDRRGAPLRGNEPLDGEEIGSLMRLFRRFLIAVGSVVELYRINNTEHLPQQLRKRS
jgi:hypothetical protein